MQTKRRALVVVGAVARRVLLLAAGLGLAGLGFALVLDLLSLRELLAQHGPASLWRLVLTLHSAIQHEGAQRVELAAGLAGLAILVLLSGRARRIAGAGRWAGSANGSARPPGGTGHRPRVSG